MREYTVSHPRRQVRRWTMAVALLGPAAFLALAAIASTERQIALALAAALGISRFSLAGLYCVHQDMSPRHAAAVLGLTNTAGAIAGLLGVASTGLLLKVTGNSWEQSLFYPCIGCARTRHTRLAPSITRVPIARNCLPSLTASQYCCHIVFSPLCFDDNNGAAILHRGIVVSIRSLCCTQHRVYVVGALVWVTWVDASPHDFDRGFSPGAGGVGGGPGFSSGEQRP